MVQGAKCSAKAENLLTSMIILVIYILYYLILSYIILVTNVHERTRTTINDYERLRTARLQVQTKMQTKMQTKAQTE